MLLCFTTNRSFNNAVIILSYDNVQYQEPLDISMDAVFWLIQKASIDIRHLVCPNDPRFIARIRVITRCLKHCRFIMPCSCHVLMCSQPKLPRVFGIHIHRLCSKSRLPAVLSVAIRCDSQR